MTPRAAHHPGRRRRRRRHRRDLQHPDRRRPVRDRADDARGQRRDLPAGRDRHRDRDLRRSAVFRVAPAFTIPAHRAPRGRCDDRADPAAVMRLLGVVVGVAATVFIRGLHFVEDFFDRIAEPLLAPHARHAAGRRADLRAVSRLRPLLCRRGRLRDDPGRTVEPDVDRGCCCCCSPANCWRHR